MDKIELAIIVNSFNRKVLLEESSATLLDTLKQLQIKAVLVFVDAGSADGSVEFIHELQKKNSDQEIVLLQRSKATFSEGCNQGVLYSVQNYSSVKYLLFYETDNFFLRSKPLADALQLIQSHTYIATVGFEVEKFSGIKTGYGSKKPTIMSFIIGQQLTDYFRLLNNKEKWIKKDDLEYTFCDIVYTSPLLMKATVWNEIEGMDDKRFPFSDSDIDLCIRIMQKGYKNAVIQCSGVIHDNKNNLSAWSAKRVLDFHKGRLKLFRKHRPFSIPFLKMMLFVRHSAEMLIGMILKKDRSFIDNRKVLISKCLRSYE